MPKTVPTSDWCTPLAAPSDTFYYYRSFCPFRLRRTRGDDSKERNDKSFKHAFIQAIARGEADSSSAIADLINAILKKHPLLLGKGVPDSIRIPGRLINTVDELGVVFSERVRFRSAGYSIEPGPFQSIWLGAGSRRTLHEKAIARRLVTLERTSEEATDFKTEFSSTFATELLTEFSNSFSVGNQAGMNVGLSGEVLGVGINLGGNASETVTSTIGFSESAKRTRETSRKVESAKHTSHKIVHTSTTETIGESEDSHLLVNDRPYGISYLLRRVMHVFHCSLERYEAALCWAPTVHNVSELLRARIRAELRERVEEQSRVLWSNRVGGSFIGVFSWTIDVPGDLVPDLQTVKAEVPNVELVQLTNTRWDPSTRRVTGTAVSAGNLGRRFRISVTAAPSSIVELDERARLRSAMTTTSSSGRFQLVLRDVIIDALFKQLGIAALLQSPSVQSLIRRIFAIEHLAIEVLPTIGLENPETDVPPEWNIESLRALVAIRREAHAEGLALLLALGDLDADSLNLEQLAVLVSRVEELIERYDLEEAVDAADEEEISGPNGIALTARGETEWANDFEDSDPFDVLKRFVMTVPTDGIHATLATSPTCDTDVAAAAPTER